MKKYTSHKWKGELINDLIRDLGYKSYLELGVASGESWNQISCDIKVGVDSDPNAKIPLVATYSTDSYFASIDQAEMFDLIYIDAYHEKNQVKRDFFNSLSHLKSGGIIIFHDINPPNKAETSQAAHGDCFAFWCQLAREYPSSIMVFKGEGGRDTVGIFLGGREQIINKNFGTMDFEYEYFDENRNKYIVDFEVDYLTIISNAKQK